MRQHGDGLTDADRLSRGPCGLCTPDRGEGCRGRDRKREVWPRNCWPRYNSTSSGPRVGPRYNSTSSGPRVGPRYNSTSSGPRVGPRYNSTSSGPRVGPRYNSTRSGPRVGPCYSSTMSGPRVGPCYNSTRSGPRVGPCYSSTRSGPKVGPCYSSTMSGPRVGPCYSSTMSGAPRVGHRYNRTRLHLLIQDHSAAWPNHSSTSGSGSEDISKYDTETPRSEELPAQTEAGGLRASREKNRWRTESH
ncbi:unnamed protein product [Gadus morhua 'NCC']